MNTPCEKTMVRSYPDGDALSRALAGLFAEEARRAAQARGRFLVLLCGGSTPRRGYQLLAREPLRGAVPWQAVQFFWGDERFVPPDDPLSNFRMAREAFLDRLPIADSQLHPVPFLGSPAEAARRYERELGEVFGEAPPRFDLVLLGLGADGHTASLFPGSPALRERSRWVCESHLAVAGVQRVTVTPLLINQAALVAFVVSGREKADILRRVLEGERGGEPLPAQLIRPEGGGLIWLADQEACGMLEEAQLQRST